jgi:hypothetical protein
MLFIPRSLFKYDLYKKFNINYDCLMLVKSSNFQLFIDKLSLHFMNLATQIVFRFADQNFFIILILFAKIIIIIGMIENGHFL